MNKKGIIEVDGERYTLAAYEELSGYKTCSCCQSRLNLINFKRKRDVSIGKTGKHIQMFSSMCNVCHASCVLRYYYDNQEKKIEYQKRQNKLKIEQYRATKNAKDSRHRAAKRNATPSWLSEQDNKEIKALFEERLRLSNLTDTLYHVDHIIPLNGLSVCGLHVPWNLQVIPREQNSRKSNQLDHKLLEELYIGYSQTEITTELYIILKQYNPRLKFANTSEISESITENP